MILAEDFYFKEPLYHAFEYEVTDVESIFKLIFFSGRVDNYCPLCKRDTIFKAEPQYPIAKKQTQAFSISSLTNVADFSADDNDITYFKDKTFEINFICTREQYSSSHICRFYTKFETVEYTKTFFKKVGQYPSLADLNDYKTKKYKKVLSESKYNELNKGIGLAGHGIGIGSLVYFRRIFEDLIFETYHKVIIDKGIGEVKFSTLKMNEKIEVLKPFLPDFIYENRKLYGFMSKGIHQLDENECLEKHRTVELGIRLILEDKLKEFEKREMINEFNKLKGKL